MNCHKSKAPRKFKTEALRNTLFSDEHMEKWLNETIAKMKNDLENRQNVDSANGSLKTLLIKETEQTYKVTKQGASNELYKCDRKPY